MRIEKLTREEQFEAQKADLYERALAGDMSAKKLWFDLETREAEGLDFNVRVNITPYNIPDKRLEQIVQQADLEVVFRIFDGLNARMAMDEAPKEVRDLFWSFKKGFRSWAEMAYAPKDSG